MATAGKRWEHVALSRAACGVRKRSPPQPSRLLIVYCGYLEIGCQISGLKWTTHLVHAQSPGFVASVLLCVCLFCCHALWVTSTIRSSAAFCNELRHHAVTNEVGMDEAPRNTGACVQGMT